MGYTVDLHIHSDSSAARGFASEIGRKARETHAGALLVVAGEGEEQDIAAQPSGYTAQLSGPKINVPRRQGPEGIDRIVTTSPCHRSKGAARKERHFDD
eukprot:4289892-Amphidinium_carterae.4